MTVPHEAVERDFLHVREVAEKLGVHPRTIKRKSEAGQFPRIVYPLGPSLPMIWREDYDAWLVGDPSWRSR